MNSSSYSGEIQFFKEKVLEYKKRGLVIFASSSFQTHSIPMLHILSKIDAGIPVYFLNTGYHFPETLEYKKQIEKLLGIKVIDVFSPLPKISQRCNNNYLLFESDTDYCCYLNKTLPMKPVLAEKDVWINGVRKDQNETRKKFDFEEKGPSNTLS